MPDHVLHAWDDGNLAFTMIQRPDGSRLMDCVLRHPTLAQVTRALQGYPTMQAQHQRMGMTFQLRVTSTDAAVQAFARTQGLPVNA